MTEEARRHLDDAQKRMNRMDKWVFECEQCKKLEKEVARLTSVIDTVKKLVQSDEPSSMKTFLLIAELLEKEVT